MAEHSGTLQTTNPALTAGNHNFSGTFIGCVKCAPATLILDQEGGTFHGRVNIGGNEYQLTGSFNGSSGKGELTDQCVSASLAFELSMNGNHMIFQLAIPEPSTGRILSAILRFQRSGHEARAIHAQQGRTEQQYDPVLAGGWKRQNADTHAAVWQRTRPLQQNTIELRIDGTYSHGGGEAVANDPSTRLAGIRSTACGQVVSYGKWCTKDHRLYLTEPGSPLWICYARYQVKRGKLYLTLEDNTREVWARL